MVTRRVRRRQLRMRPEPEINALFLYLLAVAAAKYEVKIHCYQVLSNHYHLIITYTKKRLPLFMQYLDGLLMRALNCYQGEWETGWAPDSYNKIDFLRCQETTFKYMNYVLNNVVEAGLVRSAKQWPGVKILPHEIGKRVLTVSRPGFFFDPDGDMPETVRLKTSMPPLPGIPRDAARARLIADWKDRERAIVRARKAKKLKFLGAQKVRRQSPFAYPKGGEPRRQLNPRVASASKWARIEAIQRLQDFLEDYRSALTEFNSGNREVVFPSGTYQMQVFTHVRCEDPAPT